MKFDFYIHDGIFVRKILLKVLILIGILLFLFGFIPLFRSYKSTNKKVSDTIKIVEKNTNNSKEYNFNQLKEASIKYFNKKNIPTKVNKSTKVTLKTLINKKLLGELKNSNNKLYDQNKTYVMLTKLNNDYLLKIYIKCGKDDDYKLIHLGKYSYCKNTLCEKDITKIDNSNNIENKIINIDIDNNIKQEDTKLSDFSEWSSYVQTSCDTNEIVCDINDKNCLKEIRIRKEKQIKNTINNTYTVKITKMNRVGFKPMEVCSNYSYFYLNGELYRTIGNYDDIMNLNRNITGVWKYTRTINLTGNEEFNLNKYYNYVGNDSNNIPLFDEYQFVNNIYKGESTQYCIKGRKLVSMYKTTNEDINYSNNLNVYEDICYMSERTRRIIK